VQTISKITNDAYVHVILNPGLQRQKQHSARRKFFHQQIWLKFWEETSKVMHLDYLDT